jgi:hypothetical protein
MGRIIKPQIELYGNSFAVPYGDLVDTSKQNGEIKYDELNKTTLQDNIEFSKFEEEIKSFILGRLGYPVIRVELSDFQIKTVIDEAVTKLSNHAPLWATQFITFKTVAGVNIYELPRYVLDNLVYVVYKKDLIGIPGMGQSLEQDYFLKYFQQNFLFNDFSIGEFNLLQISLEMMRKVLGQDGSFDIVNNQYLQIYPVPATTDQSVIVQYRAIDSNTIHPAYKNFIQRYALALAKGILGQIRGKYKTLPGPGGGAQLNGDALIQQSEKEIELLDKQILAEFEEPPGFSLY